VNGTIGYVAMETGKEYRLGDKLATLLVRPRGWHLPEKHVEQDGPPSREGSLTSASIFFITSATF